MNNEIFARIDENNNAALFHIEDGEVVTKFEQDMPVVWPIDSSVSAYSEHPEGIVISIADAESLGIEFE